VFVAVERTGALARSHGVGERAVVLQQRRIVDLTPDLLGQANIGDEVSFGWLWDRGIEGFPYEEGRYRDVREDTAAWAFGLAPQVSLLGPHRVLLKDPEPWEDSLTSDPCRFAESQVALWCQGSLLYGHREGGARRHERFARDPGELPLGLLTDRFPRLGRLERLGLVTFKDAWRLSGEELGQFLGGGGEALLRILRGEASLFRPEPPPLSFFVTVSLGEVISLGEVLTAAISAARRLGGELVGRDLAARRISWQIAGEGWSREGEASLLRPSADGGRLGAVAGREVTKSPLPGPVTRLTLRVIRTDPAPREISGLFGKSRAPSSVRAVGTRWREDRLSFFDPWRRGGEDGSCPDW